MLSQTHVQLILLSSQTNAIKLQPLSQGEQEMQVLIQKDVLPFNYHLIMFILSDLALKVSRRCEF